MCVCVCVCVCVGERERETEREREREGETGRSNFMKVYIYIYIYIYKDRKLTVSTLPATNWLTTPFMLDIDLSDIDLSDVDLCFKSFSLISVMVDSSLGSVYFLNTLARRFAQFVRSSPVVSQTIGIMVSESERREPELNFTTKIEMACET